MWRALLPLAAFLPIAVGLRIALDRLERRVGQRERERRQGTLEERLERAGRGMTEARELQDGVEAELAARQAALASLTAEADEWKRLAALRRDEAQAVSQLVRQEIDRGGRRSLLQGTLVNALFFALGFILQALA